jgi:hypothetical protein
MNISALCYQWLGKYMCHNTGLHYTHYIYPSHQEGIWAVLSQLLVRAYQVYIGSGTNEFLRYNDIPEHSII